MLTLQKILDQEFEIEKESIIKHVREKRERAAKQAGLQRKRMMLEKHLREEMSEIERDHRIEFWLTLVRPWRVYDSLIHPSYKPHAKSAMIEVHYRTVPHAGQVGTERFEQKRETVWYNPVCSEILCSSARIGFC